MKRFFLFIIIAIVLHSCCTMHTHRAPNLRFVQPITWDSLQSLMAAKDPTTRANELFYPVPSRLKIKR